MGAISFRQRNKRGEIAWNTIETTEMRRSVFVSKPQVLEGCYDVGRSKQLQDIETQQVIRRTRLLHTTSVTDNVH